MIHLGPAMTHLSLRRCSRVAAATLGLVLLASAGAAQQADVKALLREKQRQVQQLDTEKAQIQEKLAYFKAQRGELTSEVDRLSELVRASRERMADLEKQVQRVTADRKALSRDVAEQQARIRAGRARITERLTRLYRVSRLDRSTVLFQTARYSTFARDTAYLAAIQRADREAIRHFEDLVRDRRDKQQELAGTLERLDALREELKTERGKLAEREQFLKTSLADLEQNRKLYRQYLDDLEQMMEGMHAAISKLEREASRKSAPPPPTTPERSPPPPAPSLRGSLPAPVAGTIVAAFGEQDPRYDLKKFQRGIVIRTADKAPVQAVADGRALHAGPFRGYRQLVVLDHGDGVFTVYGYLQGLQVKRGAWVKAGQTLGQATFQPADNAYNVYFEIRKDGQPEDPQQWLAPGRLTAAK